MIEFRQKCFTEYDALRSLYVQLSRDNVWKNRVKTIDKSALIPILSGNNVIIERFVISKTFFGKDKYRMYLKLGAKVKLPDDVRLPGRDIQDRVAGMSLNFNGALFKPGAGDNNGDNNGKKNKTKPTISAELHPNNMDITIEKTIPQGEVLKYDPKERILVLECTNIDSAIRCLDVLPFGLNYNLYLLS